MPRRIQQTCSLSHYISIIFIKSLKLRLKISLSHFTLNFQIVAYSHTSHEVHLIPTVHLKFKPTTIQLSESNGNMFRLFDVTISPITRTHTHTQTALVCINVITTRITPLFELITKYIK